MAGTRRRQPAAPDPVGESPYDRLDAAAHAVIAAALLLISLPAMALLACAVRLADGAPVFYRGTRLGRNKRPFTIYKFRTLPPDAERIIGGEVMNGQVTTTRLGAFLRDTRLDELPQLINVVRGDMALVGPRPERPEVYAQQCAHLPSYDLRFAIRPGLIGYSQLFTPYSAPKSLRARLDNRFVLRRPGPFSQVLFLGYALLLLLDNIRRRATPANPSRRRVRRRGAGDPGILLCGGGFGEAPLRIDRLDDQTVELVAVGGPRTGGLEQFTLQMVKPGPRVKRARCRGRIVSEAATTGGARRLRVAYSPVSPRDRYILDQYFLMRSVAIPRLFLRGGARRTESPGPMHGERSPADGSTGHAALWLAVTLAALAGYLLAPVHNEITLGALLLASLPLAVLRPQWALCALVATFPFGELRQDAHWALGGSLVVSLAGHYLLGRRPVAELRAALWPWILAFIAANLVSNLLSPYPEAAWRGFFRLVAGCAFLALPVALVTRSMLLRTMPLVIVGGITTACVLAIVGYVFELAPFLEKVEVFKRATGGSVSPNTLALLIVLGIPFLVHWSLYAGRPALRAAAQLALVVNLGAMVTTYSRGGFLLLLLLGLTLAVLHIRRLTLWRIASFAAWGLAFGLSTLIFTPASKPDRAEPPAPAAPVERPDQAAPGAPAAQGAPTAPTGEAAAQELDYYWNRQQSLVDPDDFSVSRRMSYLQVARDAFLERPLVGHGAMTFDEIYARSEASREHSRRDRGERRRSHNTYAEVLVGNGLLGLALFLGILLRAAANGWQAWRAGGPGERRVLEAYGVSFVFMLLYFGLQSALFLPLFWLYLGLTESARRGVASPAEDAAP